MSEGRIPWNKGKNRPEMYGDLNPAKRPEVRKKISERIHEAKRPEFPPIFDICHCGRCNEIVWNGKRYKKGHSGILNKGKLLGDNNPSKRPEVREKKSKKLKGDKNPAKRPEVREKIRKSRKGQFAGEKNPMYHHIYTEETLQKMRENNCNMFGEKNHNWRGGSSFLPYCKKFNEKLKEQVRIRDNYICQKCNNKENRKKHCVHHIHYDKENCYPDLITLCNKCNSKVNGNREYWENYFMNLLKERGLLEWKLEEENANLKVKN